LAGRIPTGAERLEQDECLFIKDLSSSSGLQDAAALKKFVANDCSLMSAHNDRIVWLNDPRFHAL
jgi:hypothetical protein